MPTKRRVQPKQLSLLPAQEAPAPPPQTKSEIFALFAKLLLAAARNPPPTTGEMRDEYDEH